MKLVKSKIGDLEKPFRIDHTVFGREKSVFAQRSRIVQVVHSVDQVDQKAHLEEPVEFDFVVMYDFE